MPGFSLFLLEQIIYATQGRMMDFNIEFANLFRSYLRYTLRPL